MAVEEFEPPFLRRWVLPPDNGTVNANKTGVSRNRTKTRMKIPNRIKKNVSASLVYLLHIIYMNSYSPRGGNT